MLIGGGMINQATWWDASSVQYDSFSRGLAHINSSHSTSAQAFENLLKAVISFERGLRSTGDGNIASDGGRGEREALRSFVSTRSLSVLTEKFFDGDPFRNLLTLDPIFDVFEAHKKRYEAPDRKSAEIERECSSVHIKLGRVTDRYDQRRNVQHRQDVGRELGALLYVIRCNIAHGHKMGSGGGDPATIRRDEQVTRLGVRVLRDIIDRFLEKPQQRLAVYGTLRRNQPNHEVIADLGEPSLGEVRGNLVTKNGLPFFNWNDEGDRIEVEVYSSTKLNDGRWQRLKEFEGDQ